MKPVEPPTPLGTPRFVLVEGPVTGKVSVQQPALLNPSAP